MARFSEAEARLFKDVFVCKKCKSKIKADPLKVMEKKIACRKCGAKKLRRIKKN